MKKEDQLLLFDYLNQMKDLIYSEQSKSTINQVKDKDIVVFIGNTRGGKSTLVNYVIGNELVATKIKRKQFKIEAVNPERGPRIGSGAQSETTIPSPWTSTKINGLIVDCPGFDDNRGEAQDVANAFYIKEILIHAKSVKFVFISDINDILNDNINQFITFIDKIYTILPRCDILPKATTFIFNKDREGTTVDEVCDELKEKLMKEQNIKVKNRCLISYLIDNREQLVITGMPLREGSLSGDNDVFKNIVDVINTKASSLEKDQMGQVTPGISDRSRVFLLEAHAYFTEFKELDSVLLVAENALLHQLDAFELKANASISEMEVIKNKLTDFETQMLELSESHLNIEELLIKLGKFLPQVAELREGSDIFVKLMFVEFVDQILQVEDSNILLVKINATFSRMKNKIATRLIYIQQKMSAMSAAEAERKIAELNDLKHKEEIANLKKLNELQQQQIEQLSKLKQQTKSKCAIL